VKRTSIQPFKKVAQKYYVGIILFTDEKIFSVATPKNPQNNRLQALAVTKKKDVATKRLRAQLKFSH